MEKGKSRSNKWDPIPNTPKQEAFDCISLLDPWRSKLYDEQGIKWRSRSVVTVEKKDYKIASDPVKLAELYTDLISHHIVMRVALFFQQAIICYRTPFHFEIAKTDSQLLTAKNLKIKTKSRPSIVIKYQAAHSSTIPSLKACPIKEYKKALAKNKEPKYSSFLEESYMAHLDNSTNSLPNFVNKIDTLIDCNSRGLRGKALKKFNELAQDKVTPCEATQAFLRELLKQLKEGPKNSKSITEEKKATLSIYKRLVKQMIVLAKDTSTNTIFDQLLSVNLSKENERDIPIIRNIVYKKKFFITCQAQCAEAKIHSILKDYFPSAKTPTKKHEINLCLVYGARKDLELKIPLQKLFAISIERIKESHKLCKKLKQQYKTSHRKYDDALQDIRELIKQFQKIERCFQAMLLKDFRKELRNLTQSQLSDAIKEIVCAKIKKEKAKSHPRIKKISDLRSLATSTSAISRLENTRLCDDKNFKTPENQRMKKLSLLHAKIISKALGVDPGHYFCSFFASADIK
jgi:hypothetical protein